MAVRASRTAAVACIVAVVVALGACGASSLSSAAKIEVSAARTPLPASPDVGAAYLTIKNDSSQPDVLLSATSDVATQTMVHHDVANGITETMAPAGPVTIGPGKSLVLEPGGYHIMMMNLTRRLAVGDVIHVHLVFQRAGSISVNVPVVSLVAGNAGDAGTMPPGMHMP
jgi:copper(I)-binding protein